MTSSFDLIVSDLMMPYVSDGIADSRSGFELLRQIRSSGPNMFVKIIGMSAFPDEIASYRAKFDELAVVIVEFSEEGVWQRALGSVLTELNAGYASIPSTNYLIVCALDEERSGFDNGEFSLIADTSTHGLNLRFVKSDYLGVGAILRLSQMGLVTATHECARAIELLNPKIACMSGICAGFSANAKLGQIIGASLTWDYQAGKWSEEGFEISPLQVPMPSKTRGVMDYLFDQAGLIDEIEKSMAREVVRPANIVKPKIAPMATGSAVVADAERLHHIITQHRKIAALDMEAYGLFYAAHHSSKVVDHFFCLKTVVDLADAAKGDELHEYGCIVSASVATRLLKRLIGSEPAV